MVTEQSVLVGMAPLSLGLPRNEWESSLSTFEDVCVPAAQCIAKGMDVYQKFICEACQSWVIMDTPDKFFHKGQCDRCGAITTIGERGYFYFATRPTCEWSIFGLRVFEDGVEQKRGKGKGDPMTPRERTRLAREAIILLKRIEEEYPTDIRGGATLAARQVIEEQSLEIDRLLECLRISESNPHKPRK